MVRVQEETYWHVSFKIYKENIQEKKTLEDLCDFSRDKYKKHISFFTFYSHFKIVFVLVRNQLKKSLKLLVSLGKIRIV